jgi:cysteine desulfurase/selenocysteine lyase
MIQGTERADSQANNKINIEKIREQFPIFRHQDVRPLVYLDNASTTQKPQSVIDAIVHFYANECSNIHRGLHYLSERATESYERSRSKLRRFIRASSDNEIVL